jgi:hypothetical protein
MNTAAPCEGCGCSPCRWAIPCDSEARRNELREFLPIADDIHRSTTVFGVPGVEHDPTSAAFLQDDPLSLVRRQRVAPLLDGAAAMHFARPPSDIAARAIELIAERDAAGQAKYGASMDRTDLKPGAWLRHAIEEHADALQYELRLALDLDQLVRAAYNRGRADALNELVDGNEVGRVTILGHEFNEDVENSVVKELLG